jgi:hypothetical protein
MSNKLLMVVAGVVLLIASAAGFYRLMVGFPIVVGGVMIGQTASFFTFVIGAALSFICFKRAARRT